MEILVRKIFHKDNIQNITPETKNKLLNSILHDEDVTFTWYNLMEEVEVHEADTLLNMVVDLYITIRGHWFAKTCVEKYKQDNKESIQKSKSLRKTVESS